MSGSHESRIGVFVFFVSNKRISGKKVICSLMVFPSEHGRQEKRKKLRLVY